MDRKETKERNNEIMSTGQLEYLCHIKRHNPIMKTIEDGKTARGQQRYRLVNILNMDWTEFDRLNRENKNLRTIEDHLQPFFLPERTAHDDCEYS